MRHKDKWIFRINQKSVIYQISIKEYFHITSMIIYVDFFWFYIISLSKLWHSTGFFGVMHCFWAELFGLVYLFNGIAIFYGLFNAKIWFIFKCFIIFITTFLFSIFHCNHFLIVLFYLSIIIICLHSMIWYQVFLSNTNNLHIVL